MAKSLRRSSRGRALRKKDIVPDKSLGKIVQEGEHDSTRRRVDNHTISVRATPDAAAVKSKDSTTNSRDGDARTEANVLDGGVGHTAAVSSRRTIKSGPAKRKGRPPGSKAKKRGKVSAFEDSKKTSKRTRAAANINTRSTRRNNPNKELLILKTESKPSRRGGRRGGSRPTKDKNVTIVKMLTGTLYLYRGENPRAEFVRFV